MKGTIGLLLALALLVSLALPFVVTAESPVPDRVPEDLGGKRCTGI